MALARLDMQNLNPANITAQLANLIDEGDAAQQVMTGLIFVANSISEFLNDPNVHAALFTAAVSFATVLLLVAGASFNLISIGAGTLAAAFQSAFFGGLTPAGSLFATLQSMGMLGTLLPVQVGIAGVSAAVISGIVWALGLGSE